MDLTLKIENLTMSYPKNIRKETESASEYMWVSTIISSLRNTFVFKRKSRQSTLQVLKNINFTFERGKVYGILGPNGAGKTTLMKIINNVLIPSKGMVHLNYDSSEIKNPICFIGNNDWMYLDPQFTCEENLVFLAKLHNIDETKIITALERIAPLLDSKHLLDKFPHQISAGERQKISLLRGMVLKSVVYLFDEPCDNLDIVSARNFRKYLTDSLKNQRNIIIYTSHSFEELEEICDEFLFLFNGKIVFSGTKDFFINNIVKNKEKMVIVCKKRIPDEEDFKKRFVVDLRIKKVQGNFRHILMGNRLIDITEGVKEYFIKMDLDMMEFYVEKINLKDMFLALEKLESNLYERS